MFSHTLVIIPARSGSKGLPDKNIYPIHGKPLLAYSIEFALNAGFQHVYVSTDCSNYESLALSFGAKSMGLRAESLATDTAKTVDVVIDLYKNVSIPFKYILLLQPTSPQRSLSDIKTLSKVINEPNVSSVVSISKLEEPHPYKLKSLSSSGFISPFLSGTSSEQPRQSLPPAYQLNGAYYLIKSKSLLHHHSFFPKNETKGYLMKTIVNVDTPDDIVLLERAL